MLHQKKLVNAGTVSKAAARLDAECAALNAPQAAGGLAWREPRRRGATDYAAKCTWMISGDRGGAALLNADGIRKKKRYQPPEVHLLAPLAAANASAPPPRPRPPPRAGRPRGRPPAAAAAPRRPSTGDRRKAARDARAADRREGAAAAGGGGA